MQYVKLIKRIKELIKVLNAARQAYYEDNKEIMTNKQYDTLFDELQLLEKQIGYIQSDSPTQNVGNVQVKKLKKVAHTQPMLSLDKTKSIQELKEWLGEREGLLGWKEDGLTVVLNYKKQFEKGVTRGNKTTGEDITHNVQVFKNIPLQLNFDGGVEIRGEGVIAHKDFEHINAIVVKQGEEPYANSRSLASGSVRQLNNEICRQRNVNFIAFTLVNAEGLQFKKKSEQYQWLEEQGFDVVPHYIVTKDNIEDMILKFESEVEGYEFPTDGLVLTFNDIAYSNSLGSTSRVPLDSIAFKWKDDSVESIYRGTTVDTSRTGIGTPVVHFDTVNIDGSNVSKASLHNIDQWEEYEFGVGDRITVYKANMIIPQVDDNLDRTGTDALPAHCECGFAYEIYQPKEARFLRCTNPDCDFKFINKLKHFVSRDCMNIEGLAKETLDKLSEKGFINDFTDIYQLERYEKEIKNMKGFGSRSYQKLSEGIKASKNIDMANFINALGIKLVGLSTAKELCKACNYDMEFLMSHTHHYFIQIEGFGEERAWAIYDYFRTDKNKEMVKNLLQFITINKPEIDTVSDKKFEGLTFVITGTLSKSRNYFQDLIEKQGGKCSGSVSKKTTYVLYGTEAGSKLDKAHELGVKTLNEDEFMQL